MRTGPGEGKGDVSEARRAVRGCAVRDRSIRIRSERGAEQAEYADHDQVDRDDHAEQLGADQDEDARYEREERSELQVQADGENRGEFHHGPVIQREKWGKRNANLAKSPPAFHQSVWAEGPSTGGVTLGRVAPRRTGLPEDDSTESQ